jgi:predicted helicase
MYNACKIGKTNNIPERDTIYATGEIKRGYFKLVLQVEKKELSNIENLLKEKFKELNIKYDAGTEFYNKKIIKLIEPYLNNMGIKYKKLSKEEIKNLVRCKRIKNDKQISNYIPRNYQNNIIEKAIIHFEKHDKGILVLMCGVGKTLISLWIAQKLNSNSIIIGVPNKLLLKQWKNVINILFNIPYLIVSDNITSETIINFLKNNKQCILITTYSSSYKVYNATKKLSFTFDIKINDECHHLTSYDNNFLTCDKNFIQMLNIPCIKQLSLTATLKKYDIISDKIISNNNVNYFGEIIDKKNLLWAISQNIICDYLIQTIITNEQELDEQLKLFNIIEENDKRLFLSAFAALKSILNNNSHHLLIYSNNKINSLKIIKYIKLIIKNKLKIENLYYSNYHSSMSSKQQASILNNFENSKFGIITCVYCLGEGWDFPLLDGVVFSENMSSNIRIVQSALRASRKNPNDLNKITKIILPILNKNNWLDNNDNYDLKKVRQVIYQMGLEDETIIQKIKVFKLNLNNLTNKLDSLDSLDDNFAEYDNELTQELLLKTIKRTQLYITYEKAKKIISDKNLMSKESYYELCENDNRLSKEPEIIFKEQFTNWIDYLNIKRIYYDFKTFKNKIKLYLKQYPELNNYNLELSIICNKLCQFDSLFPPEKLWIEYYNVHDLKDIINIHLKHKKNINLINNNKTINN